MELYLKRYDLEFSHSDALSQALLWEFFCIKIKYKIKYKNKDIIIINKVEKGEKA